MTSRGTSKRQLEEDCLTSFFPEIKKANIELGWNRSLLKVFFYNQWLRKGDVEEDLIHESSFQNVCLLYGENKINNNFTCNK